MYDTIILYFKIYLKTTSSLFFLSRRIILHTFFFQNANEEVSFPEDFLSGYVLLAMLSVGSLTQGHPS